MGNLMFTTDFNRTTLDISKNIKLSAGAQFQMHEKEYPMIIDKESTDLIINKSLGYEGPGAAPKKEESDAAAQTKLVEGYTETVSQETFVYELPVTWEQQKFAVKNARFVNMMGEFLSRSMVLRYEYASANVQNLGFSTTKPAGDGKAYYAANHDWKSGGTFSNLLTAADLSKTSLENAIKDITNAKMENSIPASFKLQQIDIAYANVITLPELLKSTLDPETANNTYNVLVDYNLKKCLNHYYSSSSAWFVDTNVKTRVLLEAQPILLDSYIEDKTNNLVERGWCNIGTGFMKTLGSWGNASA